MTRLAHKHGIGPEFDNYMESIKSKAAAKYMFGVAPTTEEEANGELSKVRQRNGGIGHEKKRHDRS